MVAAGRVGGIGVGVVVETLGVVHELDVGMDEVASGVDVMIGVLVSVANGFEALLQSTCDILQNECSEFVKRSGFDGQISRGDAFANIHSGRLESGVWCSFKLPVESDDRLEEVAIRESFSFRTKRADPKRLGECAAHFGFILFGNPLEDRRHISVCQRNASVIDDWPIETVAVRHGRLRKDAQK